MALVLASCGGRPVEAEGESTTWRDGDRSGYVVWESNRNGAWRIWIRGLDGRGSARQLSPEESGRQHCCPHVAPDGEYLVYLSLPTGQESYPKGGATGALHLLRPDGSGDRVLTDRARTYFEHRAAVWRGPRVLHYIDGEGRSRSLDISTGASQLLTEAAHPTHGWLINSQLSHGTAGRPAFAPYDADSRLLAEQPQWGGCQPYFSQDGRWGFWMAGAGGPLRAVELATGIQTTLLEKHDPRLPSGRSYLYFPMLSADGLWLAFGASEDDHDHTRADYEIFVAEVDPETLEVTGRPIRLTHHPATDRFPDLFPIPLALGRHAGEAPFRLSLEAPRGGGHWDLGDGTVDRGQRIEHIFERAGKYTVRWLHEDRTLTGRVSVRAPDSPRVLRADLFEGREARLVFSEPIAAKEPTLSLESGVGIEDWSLDPAGRVLTVRLAETLTLPDVMHLAAVEDRAHPPNRMLPERIWLDPQTWPVDDRELLFLWQSADRTNRIPLPEGGHASIRLLAEGRTWVDRHQAQVLRGGRLSADAATAERLAEGLRRANRMSLELTLTPIRHQGAGAGRILTFSSGERARNFSLLQSGDTWKLRLRTPETGKNADRLELPLGKATGNQPAHLALTYTPGQLVVYRDGEKVLESDQFQGDFFHWRPLPLVIGNEYQAERPWFGTVEGIAIYGRVLGAEEVRESYRRQARLRQQRQRLPAVQVEAVLRRRSAIPSLEQIAPYREALAVYEYQVEQVLLGEDPGKTIRVVHRVMVDGELLPPAEMDIGQPYRLFLEPMSGHPELASLYLSDTLPERYDMKLHFRLD